MNLRIVLFAPTQTSLYSRLLAHLIQAEDGMGLVGITVRTLWSLNRIRGELKRDGARLIEKVYQKLVLGEDAYPRDDPETLTAFATEMGLRASRLRQFAELCGIPLIETSDLNSTATETFVRDLKPDLVVFSGGGLIRENILDAPALGVLNCHSGILPAYRGMDVVEWAILEAENEPAIGLTLHFMDKGVDTGPILLHHRDHIREGDTLERIRCRLEHQMAKLMLNGLRGIRDGKLQAQPQAKSDGRQYFVMHPSLKSEAEQKVIRFSKR